MRWLPGEVCYVAPDSLRWEPLAMGYFAFLAWALTQPAAFGAFYEALRWEGWRTETRACSFYQAIHTHPPPWSAEGEHLARSLGGDEAPGPTFP